MFAPVKDKWVSGKYGQMNERQLKNFMAKIDGDPFHPTECALWTGRQLQRRKTPKKGCQHGAFWMNGKDLLTHSLMYHNFVGPLPQDYGKGGSLCVLHRCDTDGRCLNINHLYLGTKKQNAIDREKCGNNGNKKLTPDQVHEIRTLISSGMTNVAIAKKFYINHRTVSQIRLGTRWAWLK